MKQLALLSLLALGSIAYAEPAQSEATRRLADLTLAATDASCDAPPVCDSPSPLKRGICFLKGLGQGGYSILCLVTCLSLLVVELPKQQLSKIGVAGGTGLVVGAVITGTDAFNKSLNNFSTVLAE